MIFTKSPRDMSDAELQAALADFDDVHDTKGYPALLAAHAASEIVDEDPQDGFWDLLCRLESWMSSLADPPWPARGALALLICLWAGIAALYVSAS